jgi:hypothetical protein
MNNYVLVRESRDGRQSASEEIHCVDNDSKSTICGELTLKELRAVRTLSIFIGESHLCSECSKNIDGIN